MTGSVFIDALVLDNTSPTSSLVDLPGGGSSSPCPRFALIPAAALAALAERFEYGEKTRQAAGKKAWNALTPNGEEMLTKEFITNRLEHVIKHAYAALQKLHGVIPDNGDEDAGAIMWGGALLADAKAKGKV